MAEYLNLIIFGITPGLLFWCFPVIQALGSRARLIWRFPGQLSTRFSEKNPVSKIRWRIELYMCPCRQVCLNTLVCTNKGNFVNSGNMYLCHKSNEGEIFTCIVAIKIIPIFIVVHIELSPIVM